MIILKRKLINSKLGLIFSSEYSEPKKIRSENRSSEEKLKY